MYRDTIASRSSTAVSSWVVYYLSSPVMTYLVLWHEDTWCRDVNLSYNTWHLKPTESGREAKLEMLASLRETSNHQTHKIINV